MRNYVIINGVNSLTIQGLAINNLPPITKPMIRTQREEIDGRDGDIVTELGYSAYDKQMEIGLYGNFDIDAIIKYFTGEGTIVFSNEADKYYNFKILDQIDYEKLLKFKTATITFHCQPFKYPLEETPVEAEITTITGTGENITLEDTEEAPMKIDLKGNTSQNTTTGKNLIPFTNQDFTLKNVRYYVENGNLYLNGTSTGETSSVDSAFKTNLSFTLPNGTYTISHKTGIMACYLYKTDNTLVKQVNTNVASETFTLSEETQVFLGFYVYQKTFANINAEVMIETGSQATSYEPYTNGASPNPDYPQDVHVVSGDNEIVSTGKNIFDKNMTTTPGYINNAGVIGGSAGTYHTTDFIPIVPNTSYVYSGATNIGGAPARCYYDINKNFISGIRHDSQNPFINTSPLNAYYMRESIDIANIGNLQIETGTTATTYEPYQSQSYNVNLGSLELCKIGTYQDKIDKSTGKNLLDTLTTTRGYPDNTSGGNTTPRKFTNNTYVLGMASNNYYVDNAVSVSSHNGDEWTFTNTLSGFGIGFPLNISVGSYKIVRGTGSQGSTFVLKYDSEGNYVSNTSASTFTIESGYSYLLVIVATSANQTISFSQTMIIPQSESDTSYEPYGTSWYLKKEIGKVVLNGSEAWSYTNNSFRKLQMDINTDDRSNPNLCSNYYLGVPYSASWGNYSYMISNTLDKNMVIKNIDYTNVTDFKTWLSTHNTEVYYVLEKPTYTLIEGELLNQLEAIKMSYEGQTNLSQTNNDLAFELDASVTFLSPMEINNIGNIYAKPILTIEGTGNIGVVLNGIQILEIDLTNNGKITIDVPKLEAYNPDDDSLLNRLVTGDYMKLLINEGENKITFTGEVSGATLTNYIRWI